MDLDFIRRCRRTSLAAAVLVGVFGAAAVSFKWSLHYLAVFGWMALYLAATQWLVVSAIAPRRQAVQAALAIGAKIGLLAGLVVYYGAAQPPFGAFLAGMNTFFAVVTLKAVLRGRKGRTVRQALINTHPGLES